MNILDLLQYNTVDLPLVRAEPAIVLLGELNGIDIRRFSGPSQSFLCAVAIWWIMLLSTIEGDCKIVGWNDYF